MDIQKTKQHPPMAGHQGLTTATRMPIAEPRMALGGIGICDWIEDSGQGDATRQRGGRVHGGEEKAGETRSHDCQS